MRGIKLVLIICLAGFTAAMGHAQATNTFPTSGNVGIGTTVPAMPLQIEAGDDPTSGQNNCGVESSSCPASSGSGYGVALDSDYNGGQYRWRFEPIDRTYNISLYLQESGGTPNSFSNVVRFGTNGYDQTNSFAVFGNAYTSGNLGVGTATPGAKLEVDGNIKLTSGSGASITFADGTTQSTAYNGVSCGGDYAESVDVHGKKTGYQPGDVLVISGTDGSDVEKSSQPYSTMVAGIYSTKPGYVGRRQTTKSRAREIPMAMVGIVPTKVSAENGPIHRGDLLVTSSTVGYAMKGTDRGRMLGAVVGKAMGNLDSGKGVIEVLVTLQ